MKRLSTILIALALLMSGPAARAYSERNLLRGQCSEESLKEILIPADEWVPFPKYSDRQGWDKLLGEWKDEYIKRGEKALEYNWQVTTVSDYLTCRNGGSQGDAVIHFQPNVMSVVDLFFAELAQGEGRYINKLMDGVFSLCETSSWVLSHHLHLQQSRYSFPLASDSAVDLVAGDVGSILAWVYYFFKDEFDKIEPEVSRRVKAELYERIIEPYMKDTYWWMGKNYEPGKSQSLNNWTPWCCVNCIQVFALVSDDRDLYAKAVWESMTSVDYYLNTIEGDGACDEGPSYWQQGPAKNFEYLRFIDLITGGKITLYDNPMIKAMGEYIARSYIGDGWVVNFADASARGGGDPVVVHYYGRMVESPLMMRYAAYLQQNKPLAAPRDRFIIRMFYSLFEREELKKTSPELVVAPYSWYPETEFCYMSDNGYFLAAKGGHNAQSHNHNDAGTFVLYHNSLPFFVDAGVGTYVTKTFSAQRYDIWTMQSGYHSLPVINGIEEKDGRRFECRNTVFDPRRSTFSTDIAGAYPVSSGAKSWIRSYTLKGGKLTIADKFELSERKAPSKINFLTWGDVEITAPGRIAVTVKGETLFFTYDSRTLEATTEEIEQTDPTLIRVWGSRLNRITLTEKGTSLKGSYSYTISNR